MRRRDFITLLGSAAAWPLAVRAQQPAMPVIGFLRNSSPEASAHLLAAFRSGLNEVGYAEGRNVTIKFGWTEGHYDRLPKMAAELVRLPSSIIFAGGSGDALAAKAATLSIPIVFAGGSDPVEIGLVSSLNRPGGNITGVTMIGHALGAKRLDLLRQLTPNVALVAVLVNPKNPSTETEVRNTQEAAQAIRLKLLVLNAGNDSEFGSAFEVAAQNRAGALIVVGDPLFTTQRARLITLAAQHKLPTVYNLREYAADGGLASYGTSFADAFRRAGIYVGRILNGEKPGDLPVMQPTKFELVINLKTAKALGLEVPSTLLAIADEAIE
jgi:putative ABC transport system substrate-binding protein